MSFISSKFNIRSIRCYKKMILLYTHEKATRYLSISTHAGMPKLKMVTNCFRTIIFMWPMRRLDMHLGRHNFCLLGFGRVGKGVCFFSVPNVFPSSFQRCSQNTPTLLSHILWQKLNFHIYNYKCGLKGNHIYFGQCPMFQKIGDGQINVAPSNPKKTLGAHPTN
jgi:hypothetical protein